MDPHLLVAVCAVLVSVTALGVAIFHKKSDRDFSIDSKLSDRIESVSTEIHKRIDEVLTEVRSQYPLRREMDSELNHLRAGIGRLETMLKDSTERGERQHHRLRNDMLAVMLHLGVTPEEHPER